MRTLLDFWQIFSALLLSTLTPCNHHNHHHHPIATTPAPHSAIYIVRPEFNLNTFAVGAVLAEWYITLGLNPLFDCFDCQHHTFSINSTATATPGGKPLVGALRYKVRQDLNCTPGKTVQKERMVLFLEFLIIWIWQPLPPNNSTSK